MIGLIVFGVMGAYLWVCLKLIRLASDSAREQGIPGWRRGLPMGVFIFGLVFWDWPLTFAMHRYYCATEGGLMINKTLEEWKQENPGVAETLTPPERRKSINMGSGFRTTLNQRFSQEYTKEDRMLGIVESAKRIIDTETGEVMAQLVDFDSAVRNGIAFGAESIRDYKFWLSWGTEHCELGTLNKHMKINDYAQSIELLGSNK